jgi:hypothetical protein
VAFLDSDDLWTQDKLAVQLDALTAGHEHRWSYSRFEHIDQDGALRNSLRLRPVHRAWLLALAKALTQPMIPDRLIARHYAWRSKP